MNSLFSLQEKVAIVTGSLGLLGHQHCAALAEAGAHVIVTDLDDDGCVEFAEELTVQYGITSLGMECEITSKDSVLALRNYVLKRLGRIDILVNNAAINEMVEKRSNEADSSRFENYPLELWQRSLAVNVTGTFLCCQVLGPVMADRGQGSIINIASTYGIVAPDQSLYRRPDGTQSFFKSPAYPTTKGALLSLTRFLAAYWGDKGVRVNALSPGGVEHGQEESFVRNYSDRTPLHRMAAPSEYKGAIVFLASDASSYMTGANLVVDGGWTAW
jgi:NAD(P)-dependent dehydrogenase (short-subunit alcohol dehydrogenase family)